MTQPVVVHGVGIVSAIGLTAVQTTAAARAGVARFSESSLHDRSFQPITMATVPEGHLPPLVPELDAQLGLTPRQKRMLRLAGAALHEALTSNQRKDEPIPLALGVPDAVSDGEPPADERFLDWLPHQARVRIDLEKSALTFGGRSASGVAIQHAVSHLSETSEPAYMVAGGVDTHLDLRLMGAMTSTGRVLGPRVSDGFIPGEAAAFLLLGSEATLQDAESELIPAIISVAAGHESGHLGSDEPYLGDGLAEAFSRCLDAVPAAAGRVRTILAGLNGEGIWAKEWGVALLRNRAGFVDEPAIMHPADCLGDTGAASGAVLMAIAAAGIGRGWMNTPALAWCASDGPTRVAACLDRMVPARS